MPGGINAQYGFLYQKHVFILTALKNISKSNYFTYEGIDDIDIGDDVLFSASVSKASFVQVKSGHVDEKCFIKVISNWMNIDNYSSISSYTLFLENSLTFDYKDEAFVKKVIAAFKTGKEQKKDAILRKSYDKFEADLDTPLFEKVVGDFINSISLEVKSDQAIMDANLTIYKNDYCSDIKIYELAKEKRFERFMDYINRDINKALTNKRPFVMDYNDCFSLIQKVNYEISDNRYTVNIALTKKKLEPQAKKIAEEHTTREVQQLCLVNEENDFIIRSIVEELLYIDFRDVYFEHRPIDISNIELEARNNHEDVLFELSDIHPTPKTIYIKTIDKPINHSLMPDGTIYRKGCYVYLTGYNIGDEFQISWGKGNE